MKKQASDLLLRGWYGRAGWFVVCLPLLWPLSCLFAVLASLRRRWQSARQSAFPVPVVIVGNITVGGTGKTPLLCALAESLSATGIRVGIVSRGYGGQHTGAPRLVTAADNARDVGDEPLLLVRRTSCLLAIGRDRLAAAHVLAKHGVQLILSDDGLQHYRLPRCFEIAVVDAARGLGNGLCLPAGPLREPTSRLREVDAVVYQGTPPDQATQNQAMQKQAMQYHTALVPQAWRDVHSGEQWPLQHLSAGTTVHAVAGIGHPERFFTTLQTLGYHVLPHPFPDHHVFEADELIFSDGHPMVMTEKDAVKCQSFGGERRYALVVSAPLPDGLQQQILQAVAAYSRHTTSTQKE